MKLADHVSVEDHGTIVLVRPLTEEARAWVDENVSLESWQWRGDAFACEPRCVAALLEGMAEELV